MCLAIRTFFHSDNKLIIQNAVPYLDTLCSACNPQLLTQHSKPIAERVMYDDVNETFWSIASVHSMLPAGCAQTKGPGLTVVPGTPRQAYAHFQKLLKKATMSDDSVSSLKRYFKKTYCE